MLPIVITNPINWWERLNNYLRQITTVSVEPQHHSREMEIEIESHPWVPTKPRPILYQFAFGLVQQNGQRQKIDCSVPM
jgi:hypothetical protein